MMEIVNDKMTIDDKLTSGIRIACFIMMSLLTVLTLGILLAGNSWNWHRIDTDVIPVMAIWSGIGLWTLLIKQSNKLEFDFTKKVITIVQNIPILPLYHKKIHFSDIRAFELVTTHTDTHPVFSICLKSNRYRGIKFGHYTTQSEALDQIGYLKNATKV